jgi:hypothetical protein
VQQTFQVGRYVFGVRTTSEEFGAWIGETFQAYEIEEPIGAMMSVVVADKDDPRQFSVLYKNGHMLARTRDRAELAWALRSEFESYAFRDWDEGVYIDATPLSYDGATGLLSDAVAGELLPLSRNLERAGVSLRPGGRIAIDPESAQPVPIPPRLAVSEDAFEARFREAPARVDVFVAAPDRGRAGPLVPLPSRVLAAQRLATLVVNVDGLGPRRALQGLARFIGESPCYELGAGTPRRTLEAVVSALRSNGADPPSA